MSKSDYTERNKEILVMDCLHLEVSTRSICIKNICYEYRRTITIRLMPSNT